MPNSNTAVQHSSSYLSQKKTAATLSLFEKLDIIPLLFTVAINILTAFVTGLLRSKSEKPTAFSRYVILTAMRTFFRKASVRQQHYLFAPTDDAYVQVCKKRNSTPTSETLKDGTKAHWLGSSKAEKIILNFHGGYCLPAAPDMFEFLWQIVDSVNKNREIDKVACLFLSYDLGPGAVYPRQLQQATNLLEHILSTLKIAPENIILIGDSAGANLVLALLSHISHPHPSKTVPIPTLSLPNDRKLGGAVLVSPWVDFRMSAPSFKTNRLKDCIEPAAGIQWSTAFLGTPYPHDDVSDAYNQARTASPDWWNGLMVDEVLVVAGSDEGLLDGITEFVGTFKKGFEEGDGGKGKVEFVVAEGEFHDQVSVDLTLGVKEADEGLQARTVKRWIGERL